MTDFKYLAQLCNFIKEMLQSENSVLKKKNGKIETTTKSEIRIIMLYHQKGTVFVLFVIFSV